MNRLNYRRSTSAMCRSYPRSDEPAGDFDGARADAAIAAEA
jgi:hypothetical protein